MFARHLRLALLAGAVFASPALAEPMTFQQALERASAQAPGLRAAALRLESARSAARSAGALPDPQFKLGLENYPISGPMAGRLGADEMTMATVGVMQELPSRARREAQASQARAEISAAESGAAVEQRDIRLGAALAWHDLYYAEQRLTALDGILKTLEPLWETAPASVASGGARPASALAPVRLRAAFEDRRSELQAAVSKARAELTRWTGDPDPAATGSPPRFELEPEALRAELDRHPILLAFGSQAERAEAEVDLARSERRPDWAIEANYGRRDPMFGDMISAGVTVRLPLFASRRQDPVIAARTADAARVAFERDEARRALAAAFEADLADHLMHQDQWVRARDTVLPAARRQADLETASYAAARGGLADVLEAFNSLADAQLVAIEREALVRRDLVRITFTYGSPGQ